MDEKTARFVAISCVHVPHSSEGALDWLISRLQEIKPTHFVLLGDLFEASSVSVHPNEYEFSLEEEYYAGAQYLETLRDNLDPSTQLVWLHGNHDDNILTRDPRRTPRGLRSLLSWNRHDELGPVFQRWKQVRYSKSPSGVYRLGPVIFTHGYDCGTNSDELETLQFAYMLGGHAHRLFLRGHTHRPTPVIRQCRRTMKIPLPWYYGNVGTMGPLNPDYMNRRDSSQWGAALCCGEASLSEPRRPSPRDWEAQMELYLPHG